MAGAYATATDLAARWQSMPTDSATQNTAAVLLGDASFWLRQWFPTETGQMDAGVLDPTGAKILVCTMVKRAMINASAAGVKQMGQDMGPFHTTYAYSNPDGNLYITDNEATLIKGGARVRSVRMTGSGPDNPGDGTVSGIGLPGPLLWPNATTWPVL